MMEEMKAVETMLLVMMKIVMTMSSYSISLPNWFCVVMYISWSKPCMSFIKLEWLLFLRFDLESARIPCGFPGIQVKFLLFCFLLTQPGIHAHSW